MISLKKYFIDGSVDAHGKLKKITYVENKILWFDIVKPGHNKALYENQRFEDLITSLCRKSMLG